MLFGSKIVIILKEFDDHREAEDAIYEMNGKELMGGRWGSWYNSTNFQRKKTLVENKTNKKKQTLSYDSQIFSYMHTIVHLGNNSIYKVKLHWVLFIK